ncbi:DUF4901 domain-containing protein [Brevibacillus daliensis]|uniref:DUF4901 domain-containing protein n=1 Tax=Brevibacillus daliensis TaxID=2892995 RepID=UPI001E3405A3|nr:DUF4901 domain-containing protein [Brevibacillus daliensis]
MKTNKKLQASVATLMAVSMVAVTPVWANEPTTTTQATEIKTGQEKTAIPKAVEQSLETLYQAVPELKSLTIRQQQEVKNEVGSQSVFSISFSNYDEKEKYDMKKHVSAYASFDKTTGELLSFNLENPAYASDKAPSDELAKEKARDFVKLVTGDKFSTYQMSEWVGKAGMGTVSEDGEEMNWTFSTVSFEQLINGIPFRNSGYYVSVDNQGHVTSFDKSDRGEVNDPSKFPDPKKAIKKEDAEATYLKTLDMTLMYHTQQEYSFVTTTDSKKAEPILMYLPVSNDLIDATTGKTVEIWGSPRDFKPKTISVSPKGETVTVKSQKEAEEYLSKQFGIDMTNMEFRENNHKVDGKVKYLDYMWHSKETNDKDNNRLYVSLMIDPQTSQITSFNIQDDSKEGEKIKISEAEAQKEAIAFLEKHLPRNLKEISLEHISSTKDDHIPAWVDKSKLKDRKVIPQYYFTFNELHQGVQIADKSYSVQVDGVSGKVNGYYFNTNDKDVKLPDNKNLASVEEAKKAYVKAHSLELAYVWPEYHDQKAPAPLLVYVPSNQANGTVIDATTGKPVK